MSNCNQELEKYSKRIRTILIPHMKTGLSLNMVNKEYRELFFENLPYKALGFSNYIDMIDHMGDYIFANCVRGEWMLYPKCSSEDAHMQKLVSQQKAAKKPSKPSLMSRFRPFSGYANNFFSMNQAMMAPFGRSYRPSPRKPFVPTRNISPVQKAQLSFQPLVKKSTSTATSKANPVSVSWQSYVDRVKTILKSKAGAMRPSEVESIYEEKFRERLPLDWKTILTNKQIIEIGREGQFMVVKLFTEKRAPEPAKTIEKPDVKQSQKMKTQQAPSSSQSSFIKIGSGRSAAANHVEATKDDHKKRRSTDSDFGSSSGSDFGSSPEQKPKMIGHIRSLANQTSNTASESSRKVQLTSQVIKGFFGLDLNIEVKQDLREMPELLDMTEILKQGNKQQIMVRQKILCDSDSDDWDSSSDSEGSQSDEKDDKFKEEDEKRPKQKVPVTSPTSDTPTPVKEQVKSAGSGKNTGPMFIKCLVCKVVREDPRKDASRCRVCMSNRIQVVDPAQA